MKKMGENIPAFPAVAVETNPNPNRHHNHPSSGNGTIFFQDPTPSLLLAGLLGGCGVTASAVFLTFFICLRRKLTPILPSSSVERSTLPGYTSCHAESDQGSSSNNSSPACLLRQSQATGVMDSTNPSSNWKHFGSEKFPEGDDRLSRSGSHNSYITIASFWNDIFSPGNPNPNVRLAKPGHQSLTSGSYAYAHVCPTSPLPPPLPKIGAPPLIEWYSQFPCQTSTNPNTNSNINNTNNDKISHVYSNNLHTFNPKSGTTKFSNLSSLAPKISSEYESPGHNNTSTINSTTGSLIQIDGFQCRRNLTKEENVVERFL